MQAIILAAGMGKRLKEYTQNNTKCMVKVNGVPLIDRVLSQLSTRNISRVVVVVGYCADNLIEHIESIAVSVPIVYVRNDVYDKTNNIYSLWLARDYLIEDDTLLLESDLIFEDGVLDLLLDDPRGNLALVDKYESWMDGTCIKTNQAGDILDFISGKTFSFSEIDELYKTVNIYKFSQGFSEHQYVPFLDAYCKALGNNEYYEQVLRVIAMLDNSRIQAKKLEGQKWYEIDDIQDLDIASSLFPIDEEHHVELISSRYGGYWRYPKLIDFCYLVNPYYPSPRMINEIKANCEALIRQYPSGMKVNRILASRNYGIEYDKIVVGNGASELIAVLMDKRSGKVGFVRPTFEEYHNRCRNEKVVFYAKAPDFSYSVEDLIAFFGDKDISTLVLINPDNPTGQYITIEDVKKLVEWADSNNILLIYDESFSDFADEQDNGLLSNSYLSEHKKLVVVKSISKSHGVPGLRLGVLASGNKNLIDEIASEVSIWNLNSLAEFYLQIFEKYRASFAESLKKLRTERDRVFMAMSEIKGVRPIPSQANYIMLEITSGIASSELTQCLLEENVLIKDLCKKAGIDGHQYIRVAIRSTEENDLLLGLLKKYTQRNCDDDEK